MFGTIKPWHSNITSSNVLIQVSMWEREQCGKCLLLFYTLWQSWNKCKFIDFIYDLMALVQLDHEYWWAMCYNLHNKEESVAWISYSEHTTYRHRSLTYSCGQYIFYNTIHCRLCEFQLLEYHVFGTTVSRGIPVGFCVILSD